MIRAANFNSPYISVVCGVFIVLSFRGRDRLAEDDRIDEGDVGVRPIQEGAQKHSRGHVGTATVAEIQYVSKNVKMTCS
jgi:hypothetical protein